MNALISTILLGIGATLVMDAWALVRRRLLGVALPSYCLVGRWLAHMPRGRFRHESIAAAKSFRRECAIGWAAHYLTGVMFAAGLIGVSGIDWLDRPSLAPALVVGLVTVAAPFLIMQPALGAGVAASRMPRPGAARAQSLATHAIFGLGLYVSGWALSFVVAN